MVPNNSSVLTSKHRCPTKNMFCSELMVWNKAASTNSYLLLRRGLWNLEQSGGNWHVFSRASAFHLWFGWCRFRWTEDERVNFPFPYFLSSWGCRRGRPSPDAWMLLGARGSQEEFPCWGQPPLLKCPVLRHKGADVLRLCHLGSRAGSLRESCIQYWRVPAMFCLCAT